MVDAIRRLIVAGLTMGVLAGNADEITRFFDETVENTRHLATSGDLRAIGNMLDYQLMKTGRYPAEDNFADWMRANFKESQTLGLDHWQNPLVYTTGKDRKTFLLVSSGPDGLPNTLDDLRITGP
jgi:hypothetical protein